MGEEKVFRDPDNDPKWFLKKVEVKESSIHGRGVFASEVISKHEMFERCPVVLFHKSILDTWYQFNDGRHILDDYLFKWRDGCVAFAMGYGGIYNHSNDQSNVSYFMDTTDNPAIRFVAKRDVSPGEELLVHYDRGKSDLVFSNSGTFFKDESVPTRHHSWRHPTPPKKY